MRQDPYESAETLSPREIAAKEKLTELVRFLARQAARELAGPSTKSAGLRSTLSPQPSSSKSDE